MSWIIYKHTLIADCPSKGKCYIGQTRKSLKERWRDGKAYTYNKKTRFAMAILKHGWDSFKHETIEENISTQEMANEREIYYIRKYNSYDFNHGYNMTPGGSETSPKIKERQRKTFKENRRNKINFIFCYELMKIFANPIVALEWFLENGYESKMKKNPIVRVINKPNVSCFGFHFCHISKMFDFKPKTKEESNKSKGVRKKVICVNTGDVFESLNECGRILNIKSQHLSRACKKHSSTHKLYFAYLNEYGDTWKKYEAIRRKYNCKAVYCFELDKQWESCLDCCKELNISSGELSRLLNTQDITKLYHTIQSMHFCYVSQIEKATIIDRPSTRVDSRKVYCVETKEIFESITIAEKSKNIKNIFKCCLDWKYTSGGYHWCFYEDINNFRTIKQIKRSQRNGMAKKVICIETKQIFESQAEAARFINRNISSLIDAIKNQTKCAGYHWKYI